MINKMEIRFAAISENEALARVAVSQFIAKKNPSLEVLGEIKTIVSEGVSNAIIHGYKYDENKEVVKRAITQATAKITEEVLPEDQYNIKFNIV